MKIFEHIRDLRAAPRAPRSLGFVPTLGGLHEGHARLIETSRAENQVTCVSLFLNPTQFDRAEDLASYPANRSRDLEFLKDRGVDWVFTPTVEELYPLGPDRFRIVESKISQTLCGKHRPGHFSGVLSVVMKLLQIVRPDRLYLGEKDFQQLRLIEDMIAEFFIDCTVRRVPTVREASGLALSSRNAKLTRSALAHAANFHRILTSSAPTSEKIQQLESAQFRVDYVEPFENRIAGAAWLDGVRLIDNVEEPPA